MRCKFCGREIPKIQLKVNGLEYTLYPACPCEVREYEKTLEAQKLLPPSWTSAGGTEIPKGEDTVVRLKGKALGVPDLEVSQAFGEGTFSVTFDHGRTKALVGKDKEEGRGSSMPSKTYTFHRILYPSLPTQIWEVEYPRKASQ